MPLMMLLASFKCTIKQRFKKQFVVEMFALNFHLGKTESAEAEAEGPPQEGQTRQVSTLPIMQLIPSFH